MAYFKTVRAADGRQWTIQRRLEWSEPATAEDFEHDMAGGRRAAAVIVSLLVFFWVALVVWFFSQHAIVLPWWLLLLALAVLAFFPIRWTLRRPRTIVAQTLGTLDGLPPERWVGMVRGLGKSREETYLTVRNLQTRATPAYTDTPLQPVS